ncbi:DUF4190 domain-containing protein [Barrientosiimonas endolithica]|uniref:DUF4190 domain-containing protein n=1 Tax=Barrientosiimonas endolithica TaxID=1535208 RepID=A0ABN6YJ05_9MICO|nr:DUF4190 domain-containing protein [Barrientosiimonas endolithica]BDZ57126.1 hypothetical protein GCM10025872_07830 [Barrientosiimonas endolithica]
MSNQPPQDQGGQPGDPNYPQGGQQPGGYGSPQGGYGTPPGGGYGSPQDGGYGSPQGGSYGSPQGGSYGSPQGGSYGGPGQPTYGAPGQPTYGAPGYGQPGGYPGQPGYGQPGYGPPTNPQNQKALWSMILGIASIPLMFCCYLGAPMAIAGIVLSFMGKGEIDRSNGVQTNRTMATVGLVTSIIALATALALIAMVASGLADPSFLQELENQE